MNKYFKALSLLAIATGISLISAKAVKADHVTIDWKTNLRDFDLGGLESIGKQFKFKCPPAPNKFFHYVYGTDTYTTNSTICAAAVHAGMITRDGGEFTLQVNSGEQLYPASERYGIESRNRGATEVSWAFIGQPTVQTSLDSTVQDGGELSAANTQTGQIQAPIEPIEINWKTGLKDFNLSRYGNLGKELKFICPPAPSKFYSYIYGTDVYTANSDICPAAVHAGMITRDGGSVSLQLHEGGEVHSASERYGIESRNFGATEFSFSFLGEALAERDYSAPEQGSSNRPSPVEEGARRGIEQGVEEGVRDALRGLF